MIPRVRLAGGMTVRDLNERKDLGTFEVLEMTLPAHYAKLLRVEDKKGVNSVIPVDPHGIQARQALAGGKADVKAFAIGYIYDKFLYYGGFF